ncbi:CCA tRNA nucleotidyltransferase [Virgibacillus sp. NKC19-3]|uniref:CCA tRNA nucleotidyltransferase n=1 Tax=Virgibacillus saliphilus TaxID=2831674 RepID=UPI001C9A7185|nr:CCA tRNA nucleotidyltransferase [Virgibacillus sp. NKC19-3]MBY7143509.1 CCA tRNA nucleotidyltransferase [Virgibacillus sp. NKC19-3]
MLTAPFQLAKPVLDRIEEYNHQAFFVGGCVRDFLLKRPIGDIDIATSAQPECVQQIFEKVIPVGIKHGTVIVRHQHQSYEVTTFRIDGLYTDHRHPDSVKFIDKINEDLERRDFTINALAMNKNGRIIDLFNGKQDLQDKIIRTVGDGYERFTEDPLRIIRAVRFSSQLGFTIDNQTVDNMKQVKQGIESLAIERIANEITKLFAGDYLLNGLSYLKATEIYKHLPIMIEYPYIIHLLPRQLKPLYSFGEVIALFHITEPKVRIITWISAWKCSNQTKQEANQLVDALYYYKNNGLDSWLVYQLSSEYYKGFIRLANIFHPTNTIAHQELVDIEQSLPIKSKRDLAIKGNDLLALFPYVKRGPWLQHTLNRLEKEVATNRLKNTEIELKEWVKWNPPEIN